MMAATYGFAVNGTGKTIFDDTSFVDEMYTQICLKQLYESMFKHNAYDMQQRTS